MDIKLECNVECECKNVFHRVKMLYEKDKEWGTELVIGTCPHTGSLWNRIKTCLMILTGQEYWFADSLILKKEDIQKICDFYKEVDKSINEPEHPDHIYISPKGMCYED